MAFRQTCRQADTSLQFLEETRVVLQLVRRLALKAKQTVMIESMVECWRSFWMVSAL